MKKIKTIASKYSNNRILITLEGGYEIDKQAIAVYNCLKVLNDEEDFIEEKERNSDDNSLNYINKKLIPALRDKLSPYWNCF